MTRSVRPTHSTPQTPVPPVQSLEDGAKIKSTHYSEPPNVSAKKGKKASAKKNKKLLKKHANDKNLTKNPLIKKALTESALNESASTGSHSKEINSNTALAKPHVALNGAEALQQSYSTLHDANWETFRKNLYSPNLYFDSLQQLQLFHIEQIKKDADFLQSAWKNSWHGLIPRSPIASRATPQTSNTQSVSSIHSVRNPANRSARFTPVGEIATPLFFAAFFARRCAESMQTLTDYQKRITALNNEYFNQWQRWHAQTRQRFFSLNTTSYADQQRRVSTVNTARQDKKWPHSQNYLWYGHQITTH